jgi:hypothetical protein
VKKRSTSFPTRRSERQEPSSHAQGISPRAHGCGSRFPPRLPHVELEGHHSTVRGAPAYSAVAGSMTELTAETLLAGKPPSSACRLMRDSSVA